MLSARFLNDALLLQSGYPLVPRKDRAENSQDSVLADLNPLIMQLTDRAVDLYEEGIREVRRIWVDIIQHCYNLIYHLSFFRQRGAVLRDMVGHLEFLMTEVVSTSLASPVSED